MKRRQLIKGLLATSALTMVDKVEAKNLFKDVGYWEEIKNAFPISSRYINLVNAGGGNVTTATLNLVSQYQRVSAGGGEHHTPELNSKKESGSSLALREMMATAFGCTADEIALTRNAMEGLAISLLGIDLKAGDEMLTTYADYDSCIEIIKQREHRDKVKLKLIDLPMAAEDDDKIVAAFENACSKNTKVLLICHMYNRNGQILPVRKICDMARKKGITTIVDGAQSIGHLDFKISDLGCDLFAASLHKWVWAPRGTGILYIRKEMIKNVWPIWASWSGKPSDSIEKFEDYGTVSKAISASLPSVFKFNQRIGAKKKEDRLRHLRDLWLNEITKSDRVELFTNPEKSCAITAFKVDGIDPKKLSNDFREKYNIVVGSVGLEYMPDFKANYLAADLTSSEEDIYRFNESFNDYVKSN